MKKGQNRSRTRRASFSGSSSSSSLKTSSGSNSIALRPKIALALALALALARREDYCNCGGCVAWCGLSGFVAPLFGHAALILALKMLKQGRSVLGKLLRTRSASGPPDGSNPPDPTRPHLAQLNCVAKKTKKKSCCAAQRSSFCAHRSVQTRDRAP